MSSAISMLFPHVEKTGNIVVRAAVSYLSDQSSPAQGRWFWSYHIRIENDGPDTVQLLARYWKITDGRGNAHEVRGQGVVGEMPLIQPGEAYDYVSGCPLDTPSGRMVGHYMMVDELGRGFDVAIPTFTLLSPTEAA